MIFEDHISAKQQAGLQQHAFIISTDMLPPLYTCSGVGNNISNLDSSNVNNKVPD